MENGSILIPQNSLLEILKFQPESVLIQLFDTLMIHSDNSPLTTEEKIYIESALEEYSNGETVTWKK